jgi:hypothetical protein
MKNYHNNIIENHLGDLKTLWRIYSKNNKRVYRNPLLYVSFFSALIITVVGIHKCCLHDYEIFFQEIVLSVIPSLLGFSLAGLAIIISFGNNNFLQNISSLKKEEGEYSLFQTIIAVFAWGVLVQAFSLIIAFSCKTITKLTYPSEVLKEFKILFLFVNSLVFIYSIILLPKIILNVFNFGQLHHFYLIGSKPMEKPVKNNGTDSEK